MKTQQNSPDPIDVLVGQRLRAARKRLGMSQQELGEGCGVTFQNIQKYELGKNCISASMMVRAGRVLKISAADLLPDEAAADEAQAVAAVLQPLISMRLRRAIELCPGWAELANLSAAV
ncbi:MAG: helix-turn-helix domain-containing protein [Caulobacteraceae bacterium]